MKKILVLASLGFLLVIVSTSLSLAGPGCPSGKTPADCKMAGTPACPSMIKAETDKKVEENVQCADVTLTIEGMKDAESEAAISKAVTAMEGVIKVQSISASEGKAVVCFDPKKADAAKIASVIEGAGFKARVTGETKICNPAVKAECTGHK
nr:heavy-metal-associated domain-containing protein [candidate division Zixibacteria bacterium]